MLVLAVEGEQGPPELAQVGDRRRAAADVGAGPADRSRARRGTVTPRHPAPPPEQNRAEERRAMGSPNGRRHVTGAPDVDVSSLKRALSSAISGEVRFDAGSRAMYANDFSIYRAVP